MSANSDSNENYKERLIQVHDSEPITIGRASRCAYNPNKPSSVNREAAMSNAYFNERTLSADHAKLMRLESSKKFVLWDSGSQHGVVFKGKLLPKGVKVLINSGDVVGLVFDSKKKEFKSKV